MLNYSRAKDEGTHRSGSGEGGGKSPVCVPGSELLLGRREGAGE